MLTHPLPNESALLRDCFYCFWYRMRTKRSYSILLTVLIAVGSIAPSSAAAQHVHGVIELGVVIEDDRVAVTLSAPLSDVVGFEHEPKNEEQATLIRQAASMLSDPSAMFGLADSASCEVLEDVVDGPAYLEKHMAEEGAGAAEHDDEHHDTHASRDDDHHDHHDEHESHGDESAHEEHSEVNASYEWSCDDVSELDSLVLRFTSGFASVDTIEIQVLTSDGVNVLTKKGRAESVPL